MRLDGITQHVSTARALAICWQLRRQRGGCAVVKRERNDVRQYDDLFHQWWAPRGAFAMLHWIAKSAASCIPKATASDALLVDIATGGGLLAPHVAAKGYRHVGLDLSDSALPRMRN